MKRIEQTKLKLQQKHQKSENCAEQKCSNGLIRYRHSNVFI